MKNVSLKGIYLYFGLLFLAISLNSCSDDDDGDVVDNPEPTASLTIGGDQLISQNTLTVDQVSANADVWLIARHTDASGEILATRLITEETASDIELNLTGTSLSAGDTVYLSLFSDDGDGTYEEGTDIPISGSTKTVVVNSPSFTISNPVVTNNSLIFDNVSVNDRGWIVLYDADPASDTTTVVGQTLVTQSQDSVTVSFADTFTYTPGQDLFARLHLEEPQDSLFTFVEDQTTDMPESFGFETDNMIWETIVIE